MTRLIFSLRAPWNWRARLGWLFWRHIARYEYEMCQRCGGRVGRFHGDRSWWTTRNSLWAAVVGDRNGVLCPSCFTALAAAKDIPIRWEAVHDA